MTDTTHGYIQGLDHLQLAMPAREEAAARAFYGDLLGLTELTKPSELAGRGGLWFALGTQALHLGVEEAFSPARKAHPAFAVSDPGGVQGAARGGGRGDPARHGAAPRLPLLRG